MKTDAENKLERLTELMGLLLSLDPRGWTEKITRYLDSELAEIEALLQKKTHQ